MNDLTNGSRELEEILFFCWWQAKTGLFFVVKGRYKYGNQYKKFFCNSVKYMCANIFTDNLKNIMHLQLRYKQKKCYFKVF